MNNLMKIGSREITIKEYRGERVVTFNDIDVVHQRARGTASRNFRENRNKFIEDIDFYVLKADELREYKRVTNSVACKINELHLITEKGYLMIVKSLTDDLAWQVQRELVNRYFQEPKPKLPKQLELKALNKSVVDIPENGKFQDRFKEIRKNLSAIEAIMCMMNKYVPGEDVEAYRKTMLHITADTYVHVCRLTEIKYNLVEKAM